MTKTAARPRRKSRATHTKLTISLPTELAEALRREVECGRAPSVSAAVTRSLNETLDYPTLDEILHDVFGDAPITDEEREWADRVLAGLPSTPEPSSLSRPSIGESTR